MFKFIHCADLHLDSPLRGLSARPDAPVDEIRSATRRALENLVTIALQEDIRFVVIAGDVYDGDWQDYHTGLFFNGCMARLNDAGIPVYLISGNHDAASNITRSLVPPPNVRQFSVDHPETHVLEDLQVAIHGQGFKQREVRENLVPSYPDPIPGYLNIGILHTSVQGQEGHEPYAPCRVDELQRKGYDYWALGHIHQRQVLHTSPYIVYPGNIQGRHIRETGNKGCTIVTVNNGAIAAVVHRDLDVLRWALCSVDLTGASSDGDYVSRIAAALTASVDANAGYLLAVRIVFGGQTELHGRLLANRDHYRMEVENAINRISSTDIWVEQVKFHTEPVNVQTALPHHTDAIAALQRTLEAVASEPDFLDDFLAQAKAIQTHLGAYTRSPDATCMDSGDDVRSLLTEAQDLLAAMIGKGGVSV